MPRKVLVLNQDYSALTVCSVQKAFILVFMNKAELVSRSQTHILRTVSAAYPMPSIIRLFRYVQLPYKGVVLSRHNVFRRDNNQCQYCLSTDDLTLDHVMPKSRGGKSTWDNLITACKRCNSRKGDFTPQEAGMKMAQAPYKPSFVMFLRDFSGQIEEDWKPFLNKKTKAS